MDALDEWMSDFVAIARIALEENRSFLRNLALWNPPGTNPPLAEGAKPSQRFRPDRLLFFLD